MGSISESEMADGHDLSVYQAQRGFLEEYQTFELYELQKVVSFLKNLAFMRNFEGTTYMGAMDVCKYSLNTLQVMTNNHNRWQMTKRV